MKLSVNVGVLMLIAGGVLLATTLVRAQDHPDHPKKGEHPKGEHPKKSAETGAQQMSQEEQQKMMEIWAAVAEPGEPHKLLTSRVGEWDISMKTWWAGPDSPPVESKGHSTIESIHGGRFIIERFKGEIDFGTGPQPFEGLGLTGYDNFRKQFIGVWCDSMGTTLFVQRGSYNPQNPNEIHLYGEMDHPELGVVGAMTHMHEKILSNDKSVSTMYDLAVGPDYKVMELAYTRAKK